MIIILGLVILIAAVVVGMAALGLLLAAARRTSRRGSDARRSLRQSRRETAAVSRDRDDLLDQRETARAGAREPLNGQVIDAPTDTPAP